MNLLWVSKIDYKKNQLRLFVKDFNEQEKTK
jgi:hypothetical protein